MAWEVKQDLLLILSKIHFCCLIVPMHRWRTILSIPEKDRDMSLTSGSAMIFHHKKVVSGMRPNKILIWSFDLCLSEFVSNFLIEMVSIFFMKAFC